jgi:glycosidase
MEKGVKGFRFDVINLISKAGFEDDFSVDGDGRSFYTDGLRIHEFLQELARDSFAKDKDIITVGEMSSTTMENCYKYAGEKTGELSMVFTFHHLKVDFMGNEKWVLGLLARIIYLYRCILYVNNHDEHCLLSMFPHLDIYQYHDLHVQHNRRYLYL